MKGAEVVTLEASALPDACRALLEAGGRMQMAYAWFPPAGRPELRYLAAPGAGAPFRVWRCAPEGPVPSLASISPLLGWYEREIEDLCGIGFENHPEPRPLVLKEGASPPTPPLDPRYRPDAPMRYERRPVGVPEVLGPDVQELPFGPVRADVVESGEFLFFYLGEHILHYHPSLFYKHRGMEKRFEGLTAPLGAVLAERVSGVGSVAHALAFCQAVEAACGCDVPPRARQLRVLLAELERLYNHLHYLGHLAAATTLKVGDAEGKLLEEKVKQINGRLTGSRLLRALLTPGGLRRDLEPGSAFIQDLLTLREQVWAYVGQLELTSSYLDRLFTTGVLSREVAFDQGATGPVERASGLDRDLRRDHPYAAYADVDFPVPIHEQGDAHARASVRIEEINASFDIIMRLQPYLEPGPVRAECAAVPGAEGLGWAESPRGSLYYAVHLDSEGRFARVKIKSPSFSNWRVFPFTVHDTNMMDYAINEASFGLTIAGCDR